MSPSYLFVQGLNGLTEAGVLFLAASGLTLVFGAMRVLNMAHGSYYMYGAFIAAVIIGHSPGMLIVGALGAVALAVVMGGATETLILRRIYNREHLTQLLATFALLYIFSDLGLLIWGGSYRTISPPSFLATTIHVGNSGFAAYNLLVIAVAVIVAVALMVLLRSTSFGWKVRAIAEDPELVAFSGINVRRMRTIVLMLGSGLAGLAGAAVAPLQTVAPGMDTAMLINAFVVAIVGGFGSVTGAMVGAILLGVFQAFGTVVMSGWSSVVTYSVMILVLILRPAGLFGTRESVAL